MKIEGSAPTVSEFTVSTTVSVRIIAEEVYEDAIANTKVGEKITLAVDDQDGPRIAAVNGARQVIGWIPSDDTVVGRLLSGAGYRATVRRIMGGGLGRRFGKVIIDVTVVAGSLKA